MSEFISSATVLCSAPEPQQLVLHFLALSGILWRSLPGDIHSNSLLGQITRHQQISKSLYLSKPGRGKGTAQRLINSSFCFLLMEAFPWVYNVDCGWQTEPSRRNSLPEMSIQAKSAVLQCRRLHLQTKFSFPQVTLIREHNIMPFLASLFSTRHR